MNWQLAQINVARFQTVQDDPANADFNNALDHVNALADAAPGFVWRLIGDDGTVPIDPRIIVNMSVWDDVEALTAFAYRNPDHLAVMRRRRDWFESMAFYMGLWWVPEGHIPTTAEGISKISLLEEHGPTADAFIFTKPFPKPD